MKKILMLGAAILTLQALPALAQDGAPPEGGKGGHRGERMFEMQDTNKDGVVSKDEFQAFSTKKFDELDANKDGNITKEEGKAHHDAMKAKWKEMRGKRGDKPAPPPAE
ncbi:MAG: hypothetical protein DI551_07385 [Micavibrio aeruginosavorus]|uniref:EF-hand domain-containing protein n=1 Tax=Micavibrio aeruginosavorus TaxID=349221 RepID=A0A2W5MZ68_9BACT|nr:MAG: hypothetical protein DI551_07385 [Micavibrio aeruginosavorus]